MDKQEFLALLMTMVTEQSGKGSAVPIRRKPEKRGEVSVALENVFRSAIIDLIISSKQTDRCHFPSFSIHLTTAAVTFFILQLHH